MTVGDRIREARAKAGKTQEEVAKAVDTTKQAIYKYENNIVTNIPMDKLEAIALVRRVSKDTPNRSSSNEKISA